MSDTKMLQTILDRIKNLDQDMDKGFKDVKKEVVDNRKRIDKLGLNLAELSDDALTIEEFGNLEKRVSKVEKQIFSSSS